MSALGYPTSRLQLVDTQLLSVFTSALVVNEGPRLFLQNRTAVDSSTVKPMKISHENVLVQCNVAFPH